MKNILKKQILWAIPLAFSLLTSSCSDYLDKLPENTVEVEGIDYTNKSNMYMPVSGVYATARGYLGSWSSYGCIIVRGDDVNKGGSPTDQIEYEYASKFQYDRLTTFWALSGLWGNCYYVVSTSNSALESLENYAKHLTSESDKQLNAQYAAEVRFFRAYAYFQLVNLFGDVPLLLDNQELNVFKNTKEDVKKYIYDELDYCIANLPAIRPNCRKFEFDPQKGFILNGRSYPLRGVSRHQDRKGAGIALTNEMMEEDISIILEMGANTIRLAHYQHAQYFYDLCDEKGLVIWAEIPYITMHMTNGRANTLTQMEELIVQNYNHPCIAVWGLSNEITAASAVNEDLLENHRLLNELAHKLDPTRKTTMANVFMLETTSPILEIPDVNSYNLYFGWYLGELEQNDEFFDKYHADYPDRCIGFSEYGADANPQYQSSHPEKGDYTESYQCVYHEHIAKMIADRPWLWATHVWNMFDFAADGRDEGGKHGENQKGLVTFDRKLKKDPFYLYKAYWSKEPFVHLCGSRYVDRAEDVTEIKVYSNLPEVSLYKDGQLVETKQGDKVFAFQLPITGKHSIEARSGEHSSVILVNKVDTPNPDYAMDNRKNVTNWFDGELDASCWSVKDNMAKAMADPKAGPILKQISDKAAAARGDVAAAVKDNPALVAMMERAMQRMTIESMLMQAGASEEDIKQLNRVLQGISKE